MLQMFNGKNIQLVITFFRTGLGKIKVYRAEIQTNLFEAEHTVNILKIQEIRFCSELFQCTVLLHRTFCTIIPLGLLLKFTFWGYNLIFVVTSDSCPQELTKREVEYIALSRDTTETDLKQRREIRDGSAFYLDQASCSHTPPDNCLEAVWRKQWFIC